MTKSGFWTYKVGKNKNRCYCPATSIETWPRDTEKHKQTVGKTLSTFSTGSQSHGCNGCEYWVDAVVVFDLPRFLPRGIVMEIQFEAGFQTFVLEFERPIVPALAVAQVLPPTATLPSTVLFDFHRELAAILPEAGTLIGTVPLLSGLPSLRPAFERRPTTRSQGLNAAEAVSVVLESTQ